MVANLKYNLDIARTGVQANIDAYQGDTASRVILFTLSNGSQTFDYSGTLIAVLYAEKPDGKKIFNRCEVTNDGIYATVTTQFTAMAGTVACQLVISSGAQTIASPEFNLRVRARTSFPIYEVLNSAPADWEENYRAYYTKNDGGVYRNVTADTAPEFEVGKYYKLTNPIVESENEYGALLKALELAEHVDENEAKRIANEEARVSAERNRENALSAYTNAYAKAKSELDKLIPEAESATSEANAAASNANEKAVFASNEAKKATDAANDATSAAAAAMEATDVTLSAARSATESASELHDRAAKGEFDGASAYEVAQENGYEGTVTEWLASLKGKDGEDGNGSVIFRSSAPTTGKEHVLYVHDIVNGAGKATVFKNESEAPDVIYEWHNTIDESPHLLFTKSPPSDLSVGDYTFIPSGDGTYIPHSIILSVDGDTIIVESGSSYRFDTSISDNATPFILSSESVKIGLGGKRVEFVEAFPDEGKADALYIRTGTDGTAEAAVLGEVREAVNCRVLLQGTDGPDGTGHLEFAYALVENTADIAVGTALYADTNGDGVMRVCSYVAEAFTDGSCVDSLGVTRVVGDVEATPCIVAKERLLPVGRFEPYVTYETEYGVNRFDKNAAGVELGYHLNADGTTSENSVYFVSDYIELQGNCYPRMEVCADGAVITQAYRNYVLYDENKQVLYGRDKTSTTYNTPYTDAEGAAYVRFCAKTEVIDGLMLRLADAAISGNLDQYYAYEVKQTATLTEQTKVPQACIEWEEQPVNEARLTEAAEEIKETLRTEMEDAASGTDLADYTEIGNAYGINRLDKDSPDLMTGYYFADDTGTTGVNVSYFISGYIELGGDLYSGLFTYSDGVTTNCSYRGYALYNEAKECIYCKPSTTQYNNNGAPFAEAAYVRICVKNEAIDTAVFMLARDQAPVRTALDGYHAFETWKQATAIPEKLRIPEDCIDKSNAEDTRPKIMVFGDSIACGHYSDDGTTLMRDDAHIWAHQFAECNADIRAVGGTGYVNVDNEDSNGTILTAVRTAVAESDTASVRCFIFAGGINDYKGNDTLGDISDIDNLDTTTVLGSLKECIRLCAQAAPMARIIICSPMNVAYGSADTDYAIGRLNSASVPYTLKELRDAFEKVCAKYRVGFVDMTLDAPFNAITIYNSDDVPSSCLPDKVHPSGAFMYQVARCYKGKIYALWNPTPEE